MCQTIHVSPDYKIYSHNQPQKRHNKKPSAYSRIQISWLRSQPDRVVCAPGEEGSMSAVGTHLENPNSGIPGRAGVSCQYDPGNPSFSACRNVTFSFIPLGFFPAQTGLRGLSWMCQYVWELVPFPTELVEASSASWMHVQPATGALQGHTQGN